MGEVVRFVPRRPYIPIPFHCASVVTTSTLRVNNITIKNNSLLDTLSIWALSDEGVWRGWIPGIPTLVILAVACITGKIWRSESSWDVFRDVVAG